MNAIDILRYGHKHVLDAVEGLGDENWEIPKVTTSWSVKDTIGHLGLFELLLADALRSVVEPDKPRPIFDLRMASGDEFNDLGAAERKDWPLQQIRDEYLLAHEGVMELVNRLTPERLRETGTIPWYGEAYSLDDFIVYANYAHKREHSAQIRLFRKCEGV